MPEYITNTDGENVFEIRDELGRGSWGEVKKAVLAAQPKKEVNGQSVLDANGKPVMEYRHIKGISPRQEVAVKVFNPQVEVKDKNLRDAYHAAFRRDAEVLCGGVYERPFQVRGFLVDTDAKRDVPYVVMELMEETLARRVSNIIDIYGADALKIRAFTADALEIILNSGVYLTYLHGEQHYHGDFRPENMLIAGTSSIKPKKVTNPKTGKECYVPEQGILFPGEEVKVSDINTLWRQRGGGMVYSGMVIPEIEENGHYKGRRGANQGYYASEFRIWGKPAAETTDLFMLGQVALELLTLKLPGEGEGELADKYNPLLTKNVVEVLRRATRASASERYDHVADFVKELQDAMMLEVTEGTTTRPSAFMITERGKIKPGSVGYYVGGPHKTLRTLYGSSLTSGKPLTHGDMETIRWYQVFLGHPQVDPQEQADLGTLINELFQLGVKQPVVEIGKGLKEVAAAVEAVRVAEDALRTKQAVLGDTEKSALARLEMTRGVNTAAGREVIDVAALEAELKKAGLIK